MSSCPPEGRQRRPLGIGVRVVIFLVCGISFSVYKINTTKVLKNSEKKKKKNHPCRRFASVLAQQSGQPGRFNAFVIMRTFFFTQGNRMSQFWPLWVSLLNWSSKPESSELGLRFWGSSPGNCQECFGKSLVRDEASFWWMVTLWKEEMCPALSQRRQ